MDQQKPSIIILITIVLSQFLCTSLWFAGHAVSSDFINEFGLPQDSMAYLSSAVQLGFIAGTLGFAIMCIVDRFLPARVFFLSALIAAGINLCLIIHSNHMTSLIFIRFFTGFFLAGIYPVGIKICADYYEKGLGKALGFLVGALVLGTALPHLFRDIIHHYPWRWVIYSTSLLAGIGGVTMLIFVPAGPYRKPSQAIDISAFIKVFKHHNFRSAAFGYFGHMWELYTFWSFIPVLLMDYFINKNIHTDRISLYSFLFIGIGGLSCVLAGAFAQKFNPKNVALLSLIISGLCCIFHFFAAQANIYVYFIFMAIWGMSVVSDSPLLSTLVAHSAPPNLKGTAITIVNCIGFSVTIISILIFNQCIIYWSPSFMVAILSLGPIFGIWHLMKFKNKSANA